MDLDENVMFHRYKQNKHSMMDNKSVHLSMKDNITDDYLKNYKQNVSDFLSDKQSSQKKYKKKNIYEYDRHLCFGKNSNSRAECIAPSLGDDSIGIWDDPCTKNEDCPFYKKNLNYPNKRGGCINGYCEMPVNIIPIGYKQFENSDKNNAFCYNCKKKKNCTGKDCNMCCDEQKDFKKYPNLITPDYAFNNDFDERINHSSSFIEKNMNPIKFTY